MPDALAISGLLQSFNAITNIGKALLGMRDAAMLNEKVIELNSEILSAQQSALATQREQFALLEEKRALEKKVADLEAFNAEKEKYQLIDIRPPRSPHDRALVYALKEDAGSSEPAHLICPECYQDCHKSILQEEVRPGRINVVFCQRCGFEISRTGLWEADTSRYGKSPKPRGPR